MELARGAEAVLTRTNKGIEKARPKKGYRHRVLDENIRTSRTKAEARLLERARNAGISVPDVELVDETTLLLTDIPGDIVVDILDDQPKLARQIGEIIGRLHDVHIIHGDLTTSNMILAGEIHLIDFGLGFHSKKLEDKAVDLHVLKQALASRHYKVYDEVLATFLAGYDPEGKTDILDRLEIVERRGRNKR